MAFAKFQENRFRIDGEIAENHAILVNLKANITVTLTDTVTLTSAVGVAVHCHWAVPPPVTLSQTQCL